MHTGYALIFMRLPFALLPTLLSDVRRMGLLLEDAGVSCRHRKVEGPMLDWHPIV